MVQTHSSPRHTLVHNTHILEVHNTHILEIHNTHILEVGRCSQCKLSQGEIFLEKALEEDTSISSASVLGETFQQGLQQSL